MDDFLKFFAEKTKHYPMCFSLSYSKSCYWCLRIWREKCVDDWFDEEVCYIEHCDIELIFAKAHVALKEFLLKKEGGY